MSTKEVHTRWLCRVCESKYINEQCFSVQHKKSTISSHKHKTLNHTPWTESRSLCRERQRRDVAEKFPINLSCFIASILLTSNHTEKGH